MTLDPESYIPFEVARRTELARKAYRATPSLPASRVRRTRLLAVLRLGPRPTPLS